ncbi:unnamed protein product [Chilo suppressalis]|uniref:Myb-like domain-containing protein n=1 Tax=Chilo suppressalis TaxID=168631 RepID=A0ABN8L4H3_CHISP|nr:unnamed protein product [Chilo suppressalis]
MTVTLLDDDMMLGDYRSVAHEVTESSTLDQLNVKKLNNVRKSLNFNNLEPPIDISLENFSINESGLTSYLTENIPFSFDSLRELDGDENNELPYSLQENVEDDCEINKAQPDETTEKNESHQSDFSPTDGSDFDPGNISMHDEEYGTEMEFYVRGTKKRLKNKSEKQFKKFSKEHKELLKSSSNDIPEETNSPKTQKQLHMKYEDVEENKCQNKFGNSKRTWTRRNACFYCQQVVTNFTRHLLRNHQSEFEVIEYKSIKDEDPKIRKMKRQEVSDKIRNKGNFLHNSKVCFDRDGSMTLIPAKRRDMTSSPSSFATCKNCLGIFKRSTFFRHFKKCGTNTCEGRVLTKNSITIIPNTETASEELKKKILPHLRSDETALVVKNDRLILAYGTRLLKKKKERRSRKAICSKMRDLATLLVLIRKHDCSITTLTDALDPEKYEVFIASIKEMCGFNEDTGQVRVPSIPARILPAVLGCVDILYTQSIMSSESTAFKELYKKKLDDFKQLVTINWQWEVSSNAEKTKKRRHMIKENVLPLEDDIRTVMETIVKLEGKYARKLKIDCNVINYESLCTVTIAHIIMLDRKRAGDVAEAELTFYINRRNEEIPEEVLKTLTPDQRKSIKTLDVFQIPGKRTRSVPILLTKTMKENIDLIIACRDDLKIPNTYALLFARPFTDEPFNGGKCLDKIKELCNLKRPEMITSTGMRHHIATMSQLHSTQNDKYTEHLAGFLGHDIAVHAKNYRLPLQVLQKAVVGSQLMKYEPHRNRSPPQIINTEKQIMVPRGEYSEEPVQSNGEATENSEFAKENDRVDSEVNSEDENLKDNKEKSVKEENKHDDKKSEEKDDRVESKENHEEKSEEKNQEDMPEELIISKLNKKLTKINFHNNQKYGSNIQTRFKRRNVDQTETKEKINKKETKSKKTQLDSLSTNEDLNDEICENPIQKKTKKRSLQDSDKDIDQTETKKKNPKTIKKQKKARVYVSSSSEEDCEKLIQKKTRKHPLQDSDEEIIVRRRKKTHRFWSDEEIKAVKFYFKEYIKKKINPGKAKCLEVLKKAPALQRRTWMQLNSYVNNIYKNK